MSTPLTVCLNGNSIAYPQGGGHRWVYLNWALGLRANGCRVVWMEGVDHQWGPDAIRNAVAAMKAHLKPYGLDDAVAIYSIHGQSLPADAASRCLSLDDAAEADLLVNVAYWTLDEVVRRFRRRALLDIDPGLFQIWAAGKQISVAPHDVHFTIGETVGRPGSPIPDLGWEWHYTPPCVALDAWPVRPPPPSGSPFTTVSQWRGGDWVVHGEESYSNEKRSGFLPYLDLPAATPQPLELALALGEWDGEEEQLLRAKGWRVRHARDVTSTPWEYQSYVQGSRGEFSCVKPSCVRLQNAWISDRSLCYLASGRPVVVEHTGPSRYLPEAAGLFRFRSPEVAAHHLETVATDYPHQSALARALAEEYFDAKKVTARVLERAM